MATEQERAEAYVNRLMHTAHTRFQREQLRHDSVETSVGVLESTEIRGVKRKRGTSELEAYAQQFRPEWFTHLRPNFWKAYFDALLDYQKFLAKLG